VADGAMSKSAVLARAAIYANGYGHASLQSSYLKHRLTLGSADSDDALKEWIPWTRRYAPGQGMKNRYVKGYSAAASSLTAPAHKSGRRRREKAEAIRRARKLARIVAHFLRELHRAEFRRTLPEGGRFASPAESDRGGVRCETSRPERASREPVTAVLAARFNAASTFSRSSFALLIP
jgi:hypothetical protein